MELEVQGLMVLKLLCDNMQISLHVDETTSYLLEIKLNDEKMEQFVRWLVRSAAESKEPGVL